MEFTEEERKRINELLEESREMQRQNGNKTFTHEEICEMLGVPVLTKEERKVLIEQEMREYYRNQV